MVVALILVLVGLDIVDELLVGGGVAVEDVVLNHEHDVERDGKDAQAELRRVSRDRTPIV